MWYLHMLYVLKLQFSLLAKHFIRKKKNGANDTIKFALLSHFSSDFKQGFSVCVSGQKGWGFCGEEAEKHSVNYKAWKT